MSGRVIVTDFALEAMLARRAARVCSDGLATSIAESIAAAPQQRAWLFPRPHSLVLAVPRRRPLLLVATAALAAALLGAAAIGSGLFQGRVTPSPTPEQTERLTITDLGGPSDVAGNGLIAVSAVEAWAADGRGVWHFVDGGWEGPTAPGGMPSGDGIDLAVDPRSDRVAIVTLTGVAVLDGNTWTWAWRTDQALVAFRLAFAPDGSLWTQELRSGTPPRIVGLRETDGVWRRTVVDCPAGGGTAIATTSDGTIWTGGLGYSGRPGLARSDGTGCTTVDGIATGRYVDILDLEADEMGGLVVAAFDDRGAPPWRQRILRFDGSGWRTLKVDDGVDGWGGDLAVAPSGDVYLSMGPEILRYDGQGQTWKTVASLGSGAGHDLAAAADGSIWYSAPSGIVRIVRQAP